jgi:ribosomal-protein-serine acetyltransferase
METVSIRLLTDSDAEALYAAVRESHAEVSPWMVWCRADYSLFDAHGAFAGVCGINHINTVDRFANLGYWCRTSLSHQGITPDAVRAVAAWAFANTELNRLEIIVAVGNYRSQRVAEKVGAHREGVLRKRMMVGGLPSHAVMFSIVRPSETGEQPVVADTGGALSEL